MAAGRPEKVYVWDLSVRLFHWSVTLLFFYAYFVEDDDLLFHVWAGYLIGALVVLRIAWGFAGPRHARFRDFIYPPAAVWRYLGDLVAFRAKRHLGHSPAGGVMTVALLVMLLAAVWTGVNLYVIEYGSGPLARLSIRSAAVPRTLLAGQDDRDDEDYWKGLHEGLSDVLLALVVLHIAGVLLASGVHRENLTWGMITGAKRPGGEGDRPA